MALNIQNPFLLLAGYNFEHTQEKNSSHFNKHDGI